MKRTVNLVLLILCLIFVSCSRTDADIKKVLAYPYEHGERTGLSVWLTASVPSEEGLKIVLTSPDGALSWTTAAEKDKFDSLTYYGCADFAMPANTELPSGMWKVELICRDGQVSESSFFIDYKKPSNSPTDFSE